MSILNILIVFAVCYNSINSAKPRHYRNSCGRRGSACLVGYSCISGKCKKKVPPISCTEKQCPRNFCCQENSGRCVKKLSVGERCRRSHTMKCDDCPCKDGLICAPRNPMTMMHYIDTICKVPRPDKWCSRDDQCPISHCCSASASQCYIRPLIGQRCFQEQYPESNSACLGMCEAGAHCAENPNHPNNRGSSKFICARNKSKQSKCPKT